MNDEQPRADWPEPPERLLLVQGDARDLTDGVRAPLSVGLAQQPDGRRAVVAKLGYRFDDNDEPCTPRIEVVPLQLDIASELDPTGAELSYASDLAVPAPHCRLWLHGHAHAAQPAERMIATLAVGSHQRTLHLTSPQPTRLIPLLAANLDLTAAPEQRPLPHPQMGLTLRLEGLSPRQPLRHLQLPALSPRAAIETLDQELQALPLQCDSLWLDTDLERLVLVWRGWLPDTLDDDIDKLLIGLLPSKENAAEDNRLEPLLQRLPRGSVGYVSEEADVRAGRAPAASDDDPAILTARHEMLQYAASPAFAMAAYAQVVAELAEQDRPRADVLQGHDLDEHGWSIEERAWSEHMARAAERGDGSVAAAFGECFLEAQQKLAKPHEPRSLQDYAQLVAALSKGAQAAEVLASHDIGAGEWARLERYWKTRMAEDAEIAAAFARR